MTSDVFKINNLKCVVFLGAASNLSSLLSIVEAKGLELIVVTSPAQVCELPKDISAHQFETLDDKFSAFIRDRVEIGRSLFISLGARWIFRKAVIEDLLQGHLVNFHGSRLPVDAGGGGFSWRIMHRDRIDNQLVHLVDEGVDSGPIIMHSASLFPRSSHVPADFENYHRAEATKFFAAFLDRVLKGEALPLKRQVDYIGRYNPRLMTAKNGWIDWRWSSDQIETFVAAFDDPYSGASTLLNGEVVRIKKLQLHGGEPPNHPFMSGLVTRHDVGWIVVSTVDAYSIIIEEVLNEVGENILNKIRPGDRFVTDPEHLHDARANRIRYGAKAIGE